MDTKDRKKLLLVMQQTRDAATALIERARRVAQALDLDIVAYCPVVAPFIAGSGAMSGIGPTPSAIEESERIARDHLDRMTSAFTARGTRIEGRTETCVSEVAGTLTQAGDPDVAMVMVSAGQYRDWADSLIQSGDLARFEVPVWIRGSGQDEGIVLAAIDSGDTGITAQARNLAQALGTEIHLVHAIPPQTALELASAIAASSDHIASAQEQTESSHVADICDAARDADIPREHIHFQHGEPSEAISELANTMRPSVVVLGTAHTSTLARIFLRSREQKLVDRLDADVLLVATQ